MNKYLKELKAFTLVTLGAILYALSMYVFTIPAKLCPGGVGGLASMFEVLFDFKASYTLVIINFPILIFSFIYLSKKVALLSVYSILVSAISMLIFDKCNLFTFYIENQPLYALLAGGAISGVGIGLTISNGSSNGGTEIISLLIRKRQNSLSVSWMILIMNIIVITISGMLYYILNRETLTNAIMLSIASFAQVFVSSHAMELVLNGMKSAVKFEIISPNAERLSEEIMKRLHRGVTIIKCVGAFEKRENEMLICVVTKSQISQFKRLIKEIEPNAFVYAIATREVIGNGFRKNI